MIEDDIDEKNEKVHEISQEIKGMKKTIRRRRQQNRKYRELSSRPNELIDSKTDLRNKIDALNEIISHIGKVKSDVELKNKELKQKIKNIFDENPFGFTDYVKNQKEDNDIHLGFFLKLAEEKKIIFNQTPVNTLIEDLEKLTNGFFTNSYFSVGDEGQIDTNRILQDSNELAELIYKILDKYDDHPSIYHTGIIYRFFRIFKRVNRSEHGGAANEFNNLL